MGPLPSTQWKNLERPRSGRDGLAASGRALSAVAVLEKATAAEHPAWDMADRIATLRLHLGEPARARAAWEGAVGVPDPAIREARIGTTYLAENDFEQARKHYRLALEAKPDLFEALYCLAVLEADAGNAAAAFALAKKAVASAPNDASRTAARLIMTRVAPVCPAGDGAGRRESPQCCAEPGELAHAELAAGFHRFGAGLFPVFVERLELVDGDAAVVFARVPASHQCLVAVAERPSGQELAVELLEDLEPRVSRGAAAGLGFSAGASFSLASAPSGAAFAFFGLCFARRCRFGLLGWLLFVSRLLSHRAPLLSLEPKRMLRVRE